MARGLFQTKKKDGTVYYRVNISFKGHHISLGSSEDKSRASRIYEQARVLTVDEEFSEKPAGGIVSVTERIGRILVKYDELNFEKVVSITNLRDNGIYIGNPIYLLEGFFLYFLKPSEVLKFDRDDLFYYSNHRIMKRGGRLFVNDFGMQVSVLARYGVRGHGVKGVDFVFSNGDETDLRYENIQIINPYNGVFKEDDSGKVSFTAKIHIDGYWLLGSYPDAVTAAIAYNKAVDMAHAAGIKKDYSQNYIEDMSGKNYAAIYSELNISKKYRNYLREIMK